MSMVTRGSLRGKQEEREKERRENESMGTREDDDDNNSETTIVTRGSRRKMSEEEKIARGLISNKQDDENEKQTNEIIKWTEGCISSSWITMDNYVDKIEFIPFSKRLPTKYWFSLDVNIRKTNPGYTVREIQFAKQGIINAREDAKRTFGVKDDRETVGRIAKKLAKAIQKKSYMNDSEIERLVLMSIRMAKTELHVIEDAGFIRDEENLVKEIWIVGQQILGNVCDSNEKKISEFRYDENEKITTKEIWTKHRHLTHDSFREEDFMSIEGLHPWHALEDVNVENGLEDTCSSVEEWQMAITFTMTSDTWDEKQKRNATFYIKLANTPPERLPGWRQEKKILDLNQFTMAWIGVYNTLGRTWANGIRWNNDAISTTSEATKHPKRASKKQKTEKSVDKANIDRPWRRKATVTQKIDWFVERDNEGQEVYVLDETWNRPFTTFFKVRLPPVPKRDNQEFNQEDMNDRVKDFLEFLDALWEADLSACIPTWYRKIKKEPLHKDTPQMIDREFVKPYVAFFYTSTAKGGSYIRLKIRHTMDVETILDHPSIRYQADKKHVYMYEDKIQAVTVSQAGWFAGSINSRNGIRDLESILKNHPFARENKVDNLELRVSQIIIDPNDRKAPEGERVFALHVYTDFKSTGAVRELMQMVYPAEPQKDYPMGRHMRFVPNVTDSRFIRPPEAKGKARQLRERQQTFLKSLRSTQTKDILKLNRAIKSPPYPSLMKVLTSWMSTRYPDEKLFVAIEEDAESVTFHYLEKNEDQAETIIPLLGIVLENEFGRGIWEWFTYSAKLSCQPYQYKKEEKMVVNQDVTSSGKEWNLGIWSQTAGIKVSSSFKIDVGEIKIEQEGGTQLDDQSIGTMGFRQGLTNTPQTVEIAQEEDDESTLSASIVTRKDDSGWETDNDTITENGEPEKAQGRKIVNEIPMEIDTSKSDQSMKDKDEKSEGHGRVETQNKRYNEDTDTKSGMSIDESVSVVTQKKSDDSNVRERQGKSEEKEQTNDEKEDDDSVSIITRKKPGETVANQELSDDDSASLVSRRKATTNKRTETKVSEQENDEDEKSQQQNKIKEDTNNIWDKRRSKAKERLKAKKTAVISPPAKKKPRGRPRKNKQLDENKDDEKDKDDHLPLIEWVRKYGKK